MAARSFIALTGTPDKSSSSGARTKTMLLIHFTGLQRSRAQTSIPLSASVMSHLGKLVVNMREGGEREMENQEPQQAVGSREEKPLEEVQRQRGSGAAGAAPIQMHPETSRHGAVIKYHPNIIQIHPGIV